MLGGSDGVAGIYSVSQNRVLQAIKFGGGTITDGLLSDTKAIISTSAGRVQVFEGQNEVASFDAHAGAACALALHPSGSILASVGVDKSYALYDLDTFKLVTQVYTNSGTCDDVTHPTPFADLSFSGLTSVEFHPDGHLLAAGGQDGQIKLFDVKTSSQMAAFDLPSAVKALDFSENGTWLAAIASSSSAVSIWDLRKMSEIKSIDVGSSKSVESIKWDYTGQFLLTGSGEGVTVQHYAKAEKKWSEPLRMAAPAVKVAWGKDGHGVISLDGKGVVSVFSTS